MAGDPYLQIAMCYDTAKALGARRAQGRPTDTVAEIAQVYREAFSKHRRQRAENRYLKPIGLDINEFLNRHSDWGDDFIERTTRQMQGFRLDEETIIAGSDASGHHIYVVDDPGDVRCADSIGFASIGTGKNHADSQFMIARHTKNTPFHTALLQTYAAKKRAEVSPSVGEVTDLFYIGTNDGFHLVHEDLCGAVDAAYRTLEEINAESRAQADGAVREFLEDHLGKNAEQPSPTKSTDKMRAAVPAAPKKKPKRSRKAQS